MTVLAQKARLSVVWTTGLHVARDVVQFGLMIVLVRILPAEAYGQFGLMNTIVGLMMVFSSREFLAHTLVIRDDREVSYQDLFTAGCVIQGGLFLLANAAAVALRWSASYAPMAPLLHAVSPLFLLDLPSELRVKMLERSLDWPRLRTVEGIGILSAAVLTLTLALAGSGVYALLLPAYAIPVAFNIDLWFIERWRPTWSWRRDRFEPSRRFALTRMLALSLVNAASLAESAALARAVGYALLGIFGRAVGIGALFCQRVATLLMMALYPVLARIPLQSEAYQRVSGLVLRTVVWFALPMATVVSLQSGRVVTTLYGERWLEVVPLVPWGMMLGACLATVQATYSLLLAHQEARRCLYADAFRLGGTVVALVLAVPYGLGAYLGAVGIVQLCTLTLVLTWLVRSGAIRAASIVSAIAPAAAASGVAALVAELAARHLLVDLPKVPTLLFYGTIFAVAYLATLRACFATLLKEIVGYMPESGRMHRWLGFAEAV
jgi:teichuronic acid exporter